MLIWTHLENSCVRKGVAEDEGGHPRAWPREFGKLLREKSTEGGAKDVNFFQGQLREELLEAAAPFLDAPVSGSVNGDDAHAARRQRQALRLVLQFSRVFLFNVQLNNSPTLKRNLS